jgi:cytochrome o ubiquinol oxidase operon protein cyoD
MSEDHVPAQDIGQGDFPSYTVGLVLAIVLTLAAFGCVMLHLFSTEITITAIFIAAVLQLGVHLVFFLHLNSSSTPRWNRVVFAFAVIVVMILIGGSVWIMFAADHNMMPQMPMNQ